MTIRSLAPALLAVAIGGLAGVGALAVLEAGVTDPPRAAVARLPDGRHLACVHVTLHNDAAAQRQYAIAIAAPAGAVLRSPEARWNVEAGGTVRVPVAVELPRDAALPRTIYLRIDEDRHTQRIATVALP